MKIVNVSESALESLKAMAQKLQEERDMLLENLVSMESAFMCHTRWNGEPLNEVKNARAAIAACQEITKVME